MTDIPPDPKPARELPASFVILGSDGTPCRTTELFVSKCPHCSKTVIHGFGQQLRIRLKDPEAGPNERGVYEAWAHVSCSSCQLPWDLPIDLMDKERSTTAPELGSIQPRYWYVTGGFDGKRISASHPRTRKMEMIMGPTLPVQEDQIADLVREHNTAVRLLEHRVAIPPAPSTPAPPNVLINEATQVPRPIAP